MAPSAINPAGQTFTASGLQEMPVPRELSTEEVAATVDDFRGAAAAAIAAGADGVEIHGANGYLVNQFLFPSANQRTDQYGGSLDNRIRFAVEVATAVADEIGAGRTGMRISPATRRSTTWRRATPHELYPDLLRALGPLDLAYLHIGHGGDEELLVTLRKLWPTTLILNRGGADMATRAKDIEDGLADVVTVGTMALANPDLVERIRSGAPLNPPTRRPSTAVVRPATPTTPPTPPEEPHHASPHTRIPTTADEGPMSYAIFQLARAHRARAAAMLREMDLHPGQELLLMQLLDRDGQTQSELLESVGLDHSTVSKSLRRMQDAGLLNREPAETRPACHGRPPHRQGPLHARAPGRHVAGPGGDLRVEPFGAAGRVLRPYRLRHRRCDQQPCRCGRRIRVGPLGQHPGSGLECGSFRAFLRSGRCCSALGSRRPVLNGARFPGCRKKPGERSGRMRQEPARSPPYVRENGGGAGPQRQGQARAVPWKQDGTHSECRATPPQGRRAPPRRRPA
ncbi:NADPH dehydrogenase [Streptomyces alboniger]